MNYIDNENYLFKEAPVGRAILLLALPTVFSQVITVIYNMADTFFIGQLGDPNQVAASTVCMPLFMFMTALANLFGVGGASLVSRSLGAGNRKKAAYCSAFCTWTTAGVAFLYGLAIWMLKPTLLPILGANAATWDYTVSYLFWTIAIGAAPTVLNPMLAHLIRAEGYSKQASFGVTFGGILNMVLDPIFIFVFNLQITGAAVATLLSNGAAVLYFLCFLYKIRHTSAITVSPRCYSLSEQIPIEVVVVGLPSFLISMLATISNTMLIHIIAGYSNEAVAGMGIAKRIDYLAFAVSQGMTQGTLPLIGYNFSSGNLRRMMESVRKLLLACLVVASSLMALMYFGASPITRCFIDNAETVKYGYKFLRIICLSCLATMMTFFAIMIFQATGRSTQPIFLSMLRKGTIDVALMFWFDRIFGIDGVAWASPAAEHVSMIIAAIVVVPYLRVLRNIPTFKQSV